MKKKLFFLAIILCTIFIFNGYVYAQDISISETLLVQKEGAFDTWISTINDVKNINSSFRYSGDYIKYKITFENSSDYDYKIVLPDDVDGSISYKYEVDNSTINAHSTMDVNITVTYENQYSNVSILDKGDYLSFLRTDNIKFERDEEPVVEPEKPKEEIVEEKKSISLNNNFDLVDTFPVLKDIDDVHYEIENSNIIKIENGKIVPLKVGNTDVMFEVLGTKYLLHVNVVEDDIKTDDVVNPQTKDAIIISIIILSASCITFVSIHNKKIGKYVNLILTLAILIAKMLPVVVYAETVSLSFDIKYNIKVYPQRYKVIFHYKYSSSYPEYYGNMTEGLLLSTLPETHTELKEATSVYFVDKEGTQTLISNGSNPNDLSNYLVQDESKGHYYFYDGSCLAGDSIVIVYDSKKKKRLKKKLRDVTKDDLILCWDFDKGEFAYAKPLWIKKRVNVSEYFLLKFDDGSSIKVIGDHKLFCVNKCKFINAGTENEFEIGDLVYTAEGNIVKLVSHEKIEETTESCNVITDYHMNIFVNNVLTSCIFSNIYKIEDMKYVVDNVERINVSKLTVKQEYIDGARLKEVPKNFKGSEEETINYINKYFNDRDKQKR